MRVAERVSDSVRKRAVPRSYLYAPANRPEKIAKAMQGPSDAVICDLEDAVPTGEKEAALASLLVSPDIARASSRSLCVRINEGERGYHDLERLLDAGVPLDMVLVPKCEAGAGLRALDELLQRAEVRSGRLAKIQPIIESVTGLYSMAEQMRCSLRILRFSFGAGDFVIDLGAQPTPGRQETLAARSMIVMQSRHLNLAGPVAHVFSRFRDLDGLRQVCLEDRSLGFRARACIHPDQVPIVNDVFTPSQAEIDRAHMLLAAYETAAAGGNGAIVLTDGTFVDEAGARSARALLDAVAAPS
jgi:citrate lyase subunit beta/citryl-CoA lyase